MQLAIIPKLIPIINTHLMRQVKSQALRTGVNQSWSVAAVSQPLERTAWQHLRQTLKQVSAFPLVVSSHHQGAIGTTITAIFYKFIQRARYRRSVLHRVRTESLVSRTPVEKIARAQSFVLPISEVNTLRAVLEQATTQNIRLNVVNVFAAQGRNSRLDLMTIQRHYTFQRHKGLMYTLDLIQAVHLSSSTSAGGLFADCFSKGLIRNRRKGQRRFFRLVQTAVQYFRNHPVGQRPDGWRIELYGKVDGELRAKRHLLKFGNVSVQNGSTPINYTQRTVGTKVGTFGLKVWMHLPTAISTPASPRQQSRRLTRKPIAPLFRLQTAK